MMLRKSLSKTTLIGLGVIGAIATTGLSATALVSGGGIDFGNIYSSGGIGDIFGNDNVGGVFGDIFGGGESGGISDILGGNGSFGNGCLNIVASDNCSGSLGGSGGADIGGLAGSILNGDSDGIFDVVLDEANKELGLPPEIMGVIKGDTSFKDLLGGLFDKVLKDSGLSGGNTGIFGSQGLPNVFETEEALKGYAGNKRDAVMSLGIADPGLMPTLKDGVMATNPVTRIVAEKVIGETGQELTTARKKAADTAVKLSSTMTNKSVSGVIRNKAATDTLNSEIDGRQSTQDVLKTAFAGLNQLNAERDGLSMMQIQQAGLNNQIARYQLDVLNATSETSAVNSIQLQNINEQLLRTNQQKLVENVTQNQAAAGATLTFGAMR